VDERTRPRLLPVRLPGASDATPTPIELEVPPDPANWGVFAVEAAPRGGLLYLLKKVQADVHMISTSQQPTDNTALISR